MKTVIEMARLAGFRVGPSRDGPDDVWGVGANLERFAELVRADATADAVEREREKYKWDVHSCGPTCKRYACVAVREAVAAEREACARIAEEPSATTYECTVACGGPEQTFTQRMPKDAHEIAKQIRARGNT